MKKSSAQLQREIDETLARRPSGRYYVAHPDEIAEVTIVQRGLGDYNVKRRYKRPVRVRNVSDGDEFFVEESELFRDPVAAGMRSAELARKAGIIHSTIKDLKKGEYTKLATATTIPRIEKYINEYAFSTNYRVDPETLQITNPVKAPPDSWFVMRQRGGYLFGRR